MDTVLSATTKWEFQEDSFFEAETRKPNVPCFNGLHTPPADNQQQSPREEKIAPLSPHADVLDRTVAIIGVGYVGFHLASLFATVYNVIAFDTSSQRLEDIRTHVVSENIQITSNPAQVSAATHILICVPTPLYHGSIDTKPLQSAIEVVSQYVRPGSTVIVESTVAVGMTRMFLLPAMISKGVKAGMSPERIDPGRLRPTLEDTPKIISGFDDTVPGSLQSIRDLYGRIFRNLVSVSCPEVAEMTKLYENCQRMVGIAFANEMADACQSIGISAMEVSRAAATKSFGYQPYFPGLGVGGHCVPVNPYYLLSTSQLPLLHAATEKTSQRPCVLGDRVMKELYRSHAGDRKVRGLVVGVGFKRGQALLSNSPGLALIRHLRAKWGAAVEYADPLVSQEMLPSIPKLDEVTFWNATELGQRFDVIIIAVDQIGLELGILRNVVGALVVNFTPSLEVGNSW